MQKEIIQLIQEFQQSVAAHLPALDKEVNSIIENKETDIKVIENLLDTLLSLTTAGIGEKLFIKLLEYYKTINKEYAAEYWLLFEEHNS